MAKAGNLKRVPQQTGGITSVFVQTIAPAAFVRERQQAGFRRHSVGNRKIELSGSVFSSQQSIGDDTRRTVQVMHSIPKFSLFDVQKTKITNGSIVFLLW